MIVKIESQSPFCFNIIVIYSLNGNLIAKKDGFVVVEVAGLGHKVFVAPRILEKMPAVGEAVQLFSYLHVREDILDLYGFLREGELVFFEKLLTISGVGPKSALAVMAVATVEQLAAAINEGKPDLLTRAPGVGKKTAERIVLELRDKLPVFRSEATVRLMEADIDVEEALVGLGYSRSEARGAIEKIGAKTKGLEERLKAALRLLKK